MQQIICNLVYLFILLVRVLLMNYDRERMQILQFRLTAKMLFQRMIGHEPNYKKVVNSCHVTLQVQLEFGKEGRVRQISQKPLGASDPRRGSCASLHQPRWSCILLLW